MKKFLFLLMSVTMFSHAAYAKHDCDCSYCSTKMEYHMKKGGFNDVDAQPMSIAMLKELPDEAYVTLHGFITKRLSDDTYNFTDGTDNVVVEVDDKVWRGQLVSPKDKVAIFGEIDKERGQVTVDVKSLMMVN